MKPDLTFIISPLQLKFFHFILQQGIRVQTSVGETVRDFLLNRLGLQPLDIEEKIQTVFLNGKAVDDLDQAFLTEGSSLALSGALPGLVGATMRRGGFYSSLRNPINYQSEQEERCRREGLIELKLFNILLKELGPGILARGFLIEASKLQDFLRRNESELGHDCHIRREDGSEISCRDWSTVPMDGSGPFLSAEVITR